MIRVLDTTTRIIIPPMNTQVINSLSKSLRGQETLFRTDPSQPSAEDIFKRERHNRPALICEGDSWFRNPTRWATIPEFLRQDTLGDYSYRFAVLNRASPGDTAEDILNGLGRVYDDVKKYQPQGFLLSAGGNDLLAPDNLRAILRERTGTSDFFNENEWKSFEERLGNYYVKILTSINSASPGMPMFLHGYDYPHASGKGIGLGRLQVGPWLYPVIVKEKGYTLATEQKTLIRETVVRFESIQKGVIKLLKEWGRSQNIRFSLHHINLRGTVPDVKEWGDEIHPKTPANKRLAAKVKAAIHKVISP